MIRAFPIFALYLIDVSGWAAMRPATAEDAGQSRPAPAGWKGFETRGVQLPSGEVATLIVPKSPAAGRPWIWQFGLYNDGPVTGPMNAPAVALLEKGWHVVALPLGNTFGAPSALKKWDELYDIITGSYGLSKKPVMVGLSREGLATQRWAALHPQKVGGIYSDRAVCDFKSWPGGKLGIGKGSARDWESLIKVYGFASEAEALAYKENPVNFAGVLANAKIPMLHVVGEKDDVVPPAECVGSPDSTEGRRWRHDNRYGARHRSSPARFGGSETRN